LSGSDAVAAYIRAEDDFLIATHVGPDGDALGSSIALSMALDALGKKSLVYCKDGVPEIYRFLPSAGRVKNAIEKPEAGGKALLLLDCGTPERAGLEGYGFRRSAVIDHHETEWDFGEVCWVDPTMPATGMMVLELIRALGVRPTPEMAANLYTAIALDTGTFRYSNTDAAALRAAADLVDAGAVPGDIAEGLYSTWSKGRFNLLCMNMGTLAVEGRTALSTVTLGMFKATDTTQYDTENFVNFPLMMKDIRVSALIREVEAGKWKVSLRSRGEVNVARVAERFKGGGHKNAAGCTVEGDLPAVKKLVMDALHALLGEA
jgi:phosphoesterase RecJ-like protein